MSVCVARGEVCCSVCSPVSVCVARGEWYSSVEMNERIRRVRVGGPDGRTPQGYRTDARTLSSFCNIDFVRFEHPSSALPMKLAASNIEHQ